MNEIFITDDDPIEKKIPQDDFISFPLNTDLSVTNNPFTSEKSEKFTYRNLQVQTIHEIYPSVIKQSLNNSFFDPSFFKPTSKYNDFFSPPATLFDIEGTVKYQKKSCSED